MLRKPHKDIASCQLHELPESLLRHVISFLPAKDAAAMSLVSRSFRHLAGAEDLWTGLLHKDFRLDENFAYISASDGGRLHREALRSPGTSPFLRSQEAATAHRLLPGRILPSGSRSPVSVHATTPRSPHNIASTPSFGSSVAAVSSPTGSRGGESRFKAYRSLFAKHVQVVGTETLAREQARGLVHSLRRRFILRRWLNVAQFGLGLPSGPILLFAWMLLLLLRTSGVAPNLPWAAVFAPLIAMPLLLVSCMGLGLVTRCLSIRALVAYERAKLLTLPTVIGPRADAEKAISKRPIIPSVWLDQHLGDKNTLAEYAFRVVRAGRSETLDEMPPVWHVIRWLVIATFILALVIAPIMDLAKLSGAVSVSWVAALTPTWIFLLLLPAVPYTGLLPCLRYLSGKRTFAVMFTVVGSIAGAQLALSAWVMDGADIAPAVVLIPMWIVTAAIGLTALAVFVISFCRRPRHWRRKRAVVGCGLLIVASVFLGSLLPALFAWQDGETEKLARAVLVPLLMLFASAAAGVLVFTYKEHRRAQMQAFRGLYSGVWSRTRHNITALMPGGHGAHTSLQALARDMEAATKGTWFAGLRVAGVRHIDAGLGEMMGVPV